MSKMAIIGLTGPTGAGKSALAEAAVRYGCRHADCDVLARLAVEPGMPALSLLSEAFGSDIIRPDGVLDRPLLAKRAFPTQEGRDKLNSIVHPAVIELLEEFISLSDSQGAAGVVIDAPLLFESKLDERCDAVIAVVAPDQFRLERIMKRDGLTEEAAKLRMAAQHHCEYYSGRADYTIVNDGSVERLHKQAGHVLELILKGENQ